MTMIESGERGLTLTRNLAWTIASALVAAGLWVGMQVATLRGDTLQLTRAIDTLRAELSAEITASEAREGALAARVRANETSLARQDERLSLILSAINKIDTRLERMERSAPLR